MRRFTLLSTLVVISIALLAGMQQIPNSKIKKTTSDYAKYKTNACKEKSVKATGVVTSQEAQNQSGTFTLQWKLKFPKFL